MTNNLSGYMRDVFIERVYERMHADKNMYFLCADFGSPKLDLLKETFKDRFINAGIAEQNLVNLSCGLALEGCTVYAYAIAPFLTMRAFEQIRVNCAIQSQLRPVNVNLVGVGSGVSYDVSGPTHHCLEDISLMMTLPNITVFSPADSFTAGAFVPYTFRFRQPKYIRFDSKPLKQIYTSASQLDFSAGFSVLRQGGKKVCLVATGQMTHKALELAAQAGAKLNPAVVDVYLLRPLDTDKLAAFLRRFDVVVSMEEGFINKAGLDSIVAGMLRGPDRLFRVGFNDRYSFNIGSRQYLYDQAGIGDSTIIRGIERMLKRV